MAASVLFKDMFELPTAVAGYDLWEQIEVPDLGGAPPMEAPTDLDGNALTSPATQNAIAWYNHLSNDDPRPADKIVLVSNEAYQFTLIVAVEGELTLPGLSKAHLSVKDATITLALTIDADGVAVTFQAGLTGRFEKPLLRPMRVSPSNADEYEEDFSRADVTLDLVENLTLTLGFDPEGAFYADTTLTFVLPEEPFALGKSSFVVADPANKPTGVSSAFGIRYDSRSKSTTFVVRWVTNKLRQMLRKLSSSLDDQTPIEQADVLTALLRLEPGDDGENRVTELRVDWAMAGVSRTFNLPGLAVSTPDAGRLSVWARDGEAELSKISLLLTMPTGAELTGESTFAMGRDGQREMHNQPKQLGAGSGANSGGAAEDALLKLTMTQALVDENDDPLDLTLLLLEFDTEQADLPTFFKQLAEPLPELDPADIALPEPDEDEEAADDPYTGLDGESWDLKVVLNPDNFEFPFLKQGDSKQGGRSNKRAQSIEIVKPEGEDGIPIFVDFDAATLSMPVTIRVTIGTIVLDSAIVMGFNWETFAFSVDHGDGLKLMGTKEVYETDRKFLGLNWRIRGTPVEDAAAIEAAGEVKQETRYHYFTLVTKDNDYQIQQAPGCTIEIEYDRASKDPIGFAVSDFVLSDKGVSLTAEVIDRPARLNGVDTKFRFAGSKLTIVENAIQDFTLAGSGPLPPALAGDAMVDVALEFGQDEDGDLTLKSGAAKLQGEGLLDAKSTRFELSIDAIGLKFVVEDGFHAFFTLTGKARFKLQKGDSKSGPLALMPNIQIELIDCPLTGDPSVIAKHISFLIELPKPVSFRFLGAYTFELRAIGFLPAADVFGGDPAMQISGQLMFAKGGGDAPTSQADYHSLFIGLPEPGDFFPRLAFKNLPLLLNLGEAFQLNGTLDFYDEPEMQGFSGEGSVTIKGLPTMAAAFAFVRVRKTPEADWQRAWFIYLEAREVSFQVPKLPLFLREVGLGFGYRYTLVSIRAADEQNDVRELLKALQALSATQGNLSSRSQWALDLEDPGQDPRWTIVLRAMFSQLSASPSPLKYLPDKERYLPNNYLFDAVIAFRSDLTFFMAVRGWINTNYVTFNEGDEEIRSKPFISGFVLFSPRQKRLLANVASVPDGYIGDTPYLSEFVKEALRSVRFSATLLIEPGLTHFELGWPNMLRWGYELGPLKVEVSGGFIFRVTTKELVIGISLLARGTLNIEAELSLKLVGVRVYAFASLSYGARMIGVARFDDPSKSLIYGGIGLDMRIRLGFELWIKIPLLFVTIELSFNFSLSIGFTAGLEVGFANTSFGLRGQGTLAISAMGHSLTVSASFSYQDGVVNQARIATEAYMNLGLEAEDVDTTLPGIDTNAADAQALSANGAAAATGGPVIAAAAQDTSQQGGTQAPAPPPSERPRVQPAVLPASQVAKARRAGAGATGGVVVTGAEVTDGEPQPVVMQFATPDYQMFVIRPRQTGQTGYFVLMPRGENADGTKMEPGFLPPPPLRLRFPNATKDEQGNDITLSAMLDAGTVPAMIRAELDLLYGESTLLNTLRTVTPGTAWTLQHGSATFDLRTATQQTANGRVTLLLAELRVEEDFELILPGMPEGMDLRHFDPVNDVWREVAPDNKLTWQANWDADLFTATEYDNPNNATEGRPVNPRQGQSLTLAQYLTQAYRLVDHPGSVQAVPTGDPVMPRNAARIEDERIHNPTDDAFEAAVRGALEQFQGSPFFKRDPNLAYDALLEEAFAEDSTIYAADGYDDPDPAVRRATQANQQAQQLRGMVIQDIITGLERYSVLDDDAREDHERASLPFQMGLVFAYTLTPPEGETSVQAPDWLDTLLDEDVLAAEPGSIPRLRQRHNPLVGRLPKDGAVVPVEPFNTIGTDFRYNPPQFQRVRQYSDAGTIAIAWDLAWPVRFNRWISPAQIEPEHHLLHYDVRRRALDSSERDVTFTVKNAEALALQADGDDTLLTRLKPRFNLVDQFDTDTAADLAALPATGRSYLYTITPVDFAGNPGRPLTLVATRYPTQPPQVPADAELTVAYALNSDDLRLTTPLEADPDAGTFDAPEIVNPAAVQVRWTRLSRARSGPDVPVAQYRLVFRRERTVPVGSYGLDSDTQRPPASAMPSSAARPRPDDIRIAVDPLTDPADPSKLSAAVDLAALRAAGILDPVWQPEAWRVFIQTESANGVPSPLAPVDLLLQVRGREDGPVEERKPAELEFIAYPVRLPVLPPEDTHITPGPAHVPMPDPTGDFRFDDTLAGVGYRAHPAGIRAARLRWNQGPSHIDGYPLDLHAGYRLYQLDIDAHTDATFDDEDDLAAALRQIQDVRMLPADDLLLLPADTLSTVQWEAWYPSSLLRLRSPEQMEAARSETPYGPWFSWRESVLNWPQTSLLFEADGQRRPVHAWLQAILDHLGETQGYIVDVQTGPPMQPVDLAGFLSSTPPGTDPYGWGVLQRLGLSMAFTLHDPDTGGFVTGRDLLAAVRRAVDAAPADCQPHLFIEALFQPGRSIELAEEAATHDGLLALVQVSLRPTFTQTRAYGLMVIEADGGTEFVVEFTLTENATLINRAEPAAGQIALERDPAQPNEPVRVPVRVPMTGRLELLVRSSGANLPSALVTYQLANDPAAWYSASGSPLADLRTQTRVIAFNNKANWDNATTTQREQFIDGLHANDQDAAEGLLTLHWEPVMPVSMADDMLEIAALFTVPDDLPERLADSTTPEGASWAALKTLLEALNGPAEPQISLPVDKNTIQQVQADVLTWTRRFFEQGGAVAEVNDAAASALYRTASGPWLATAYPRSGSPAFASLDAAGRLKYDHLISDKWAHNYRFYVRPYSRYALLWQSLLASPALFPDGVGVPGVINAPDTLADPVPVQPERGGLDLVLGRTQPVEPPTVLNSARLDRPARPGSPVPPGPVWEVIVAQHHEQALMERNQSIARQIGFRNIAFSLLRRVNPDGSSAEGDGWLTRLNRLASVTLRLEAVSSDLDTVSLPAAYPDAPDHVEVQALDREDDRFRALALPQRMTAFQQGAMALQWEGLPFYYEHRLLLIAQTTDTVSRVNSITQRDFEYRSPLPPDHRFAATMQPGIHEPTGTRTRRVRFLLRRLWDSLPDSAQQAWPIEAPVLRELTPVTGMTVDVKPGELPDPDVVYQIVTEYQGNVEVQVEIYYDRTANDGRGSFAARQLGRFFTSEPTAGFGMTFRLPVVDDPRRAEMPVGLDVLAEVDSALRQVVTVTLDQDPADLAAWNRALSVYGPELVAYEAGTRRVTFFDVMTRSLRRDLLAALTYAPDRQRIEDAYLMWRGQVAASKLLTEAQLNALDPGLRDLIEQPDPGGFALGWFGPRDDTDTTDADFLTETDIAALRALPGDRAFQAAVEELIELAGQPPRDAMQRPRDRFVEVATALDPYQIPRSLRLRRDPELPPPVQIEPPLSQDSATVDRLVWSGLMYDRDRDALLAYAQLPEMRSAAENVITRLDAAEFMSDPLPAPRPLQGELEPVIRERLRIDNQRGGALAWFASGGGTSGVPTDQQLNVLLALDGDEDFLTARDRLVTRIASAHAPVGPNASLDQSGLSGDTKAMLALTDGRLMWTGGARAAGEAPMMPPNEDQYSELVTYAQDAEVRHAVGLIADQFNKRITYKETVFGNIRPAPAVPPALAGKLTVRTEQSRGLFAAYELIWSGGPVSGEEGSLLQDYAGDFRRETNSEAMQTLLSRIRGIQAEPVPMPQEDPSARRASPPVNDMLPQALVGKLGVDNGNRLHWNQSGPPTEDEYNSMMDFAAEADLKRAVGRLLDWFDGAHAVALPYMVDRPRQSDLLLGTTEAGASSPIGTQITVNAIVNGEDRPVDGDRIRWRGRFADPQRRDALLALKTASKTDNPNEADRVFDAAIDQVLEAMLTHQETEAIGLPRRPRPQDLPPALRERLVIGRWRLAYHGIMTVDDALALIRSYNEVPDQRAIARLYVLSFERGLNGRSIMLRVRRGSAAPTPFETIHAEPLPLEDILNLPE